jgi:phosphonopyruvate decarboxylase
MIAVDKFNNCLLDAELNYFTGVPDSTLKEWLKLIFNNSIDFTNRIAANEGAAISNATGYYLSTGKVGVVYLQNSGLGNCINPLTSLTDPEVYGIPMLMLIGWRGVPGKKDEPQHKKMGVVTEKILLALGIPYAILDDGSYADQINDAVKISKLNQQPYALIVKPGVFSEYAISTNTKKSTGMVREDAIQTVVDTIENSDLILSTTGKASRELYEVCRTKSRGHNNNFYNVGSMGHVGAIGLEVALQKKDKLTYVLDGDGALIMHMGTLASIGKYQPENFVHIVFDNEVHESTGSQPTLSDVVDIAGVMKKCNYRKVETVIDSTSLIKALSGSISGPLGIVIKVIAGSRSDLGRPIDTPAITKNRFMDWNKE